MDFRSKLIMLFCLVAVLVSCVPADGAQPCKYIKLKEGGSETECAACCADNGLAKAVSFNMCRCRTQNFDELYPATSSPSPLSA